MAARRRWLPGEYRYDVDIRLGDFIRLACENATSAGAAGQRLRITCTRPLPAAYSSFSRSRLGRLDSSSSAAPVCPAYTHTHTHTETWGGLHYRQPMSGDARQRAGILSSGLHSSFRLSPTQNLSREEVTHHHNKHTSKQTNKQTRINKQRRRHRW